MKRLPRSAKAKLRASGGFSLPELLLTMLILLLMTEIMTDGIYAVRQAYRKAVDAANAETYLNTVIIALRSKLSLAAKTDRANICLDPELGYYEIKNDPAQGIVIQYLDVDMQPREADPQPLLRSEDFISSFGRIAPYGNSDSPFFTVTNLQVRKKGDEEPLAKADEYIIHTVNP